MARLVIISAFLFLSCIRPFSPSSLSNSDDDCRSKSHVQETTLRYLPQLNRLYNERLEINPDVKGRMVVIFYVQSSGLVTQPPVIESSSLNDTVFEKQVIKYIKTWNYGKCECRKKTMQIMYPLDFNTDLKNARIGK
jgi:hypothetical protein